jgi:hypothetical protein
MPFNPIRRSIFFKLCRRAVSTLTVLVLAPCPIVHAQTQDQNRVSGAVYGPLSFTEPNQLDAPSIASRPSLKLRRPFATNPLLGRVARNNMPGNLRRLHPIDDGTTFDVSQSPFLSKLSDWASPDHSLDKFAPANGKMSFGQMGDDRTDLSTNYDQSIEHTDMLGRSYSTHSGDWLPSPVNLYSNGGFGIRAPNGFVNMPPQNGHVEETFSH